MGPGYSVSKPTWRPSLLFLFFVGRHISAQNFALGSLRSDDWHLGRPTAPPLLSVFRVFTPVLAKHSKSFSLIDCISVGVDRMQRNFEPMRKQVELWQRSELTDVTAKVVIDE